MKRTGNLFVEKNISHRLENVRIESERKLADVASSGVGIEDLVEFLGLVACRLDNFALAEIEANPVKGDALVNCWRVKCDMAFHRIFHWRCEHFTIRNIPVPSANDCWNSFDAKSQIRSRSFDFDAVGFFHQRSQRSHSWLEFAVVERANFEVKIFKSL